jgi:hypothetical protein
VSRRLCDPQRLVELVADQMFREEMRSRNGGPAISENGVGPTRQGERARAALAAGDQPSPGDPPD